MTKWFRFYGDALNDPKVQMLPPETFKSWVNVLCLASQNDGVLGTIDEIEGAKSDFAIKDSKSIDKIFIVASTGKSVTLSKQDTNWLVNGKYNARPDNIRLLLKTFRRIDVRSPVPKAAVNNIITEIATGATKVEIYQGNDKPSKIYYVGNPTNDNQGTYMILETDGVKSTDVSWNPLCK